jgi:CspA family cold shock protein
MAATLRETVTRSPLLFPKARVTISLDRFPLASLTDRSSPVSRGPNGIASRRGASPDVLPHRRGDALQTGTVKWFNPVKGFGFIQPDRGGPDAFVHISAVERAGLEGLREGERIQYELVRGRDGKNSAEELKPVR